MAKARTSRKAKGRSPDPAKELLAAADAGDLHAMKRALAAGGDVNAKDKPRRDRDEEDPTRGRSALMRCAARGDADGVKLLLKAGANPNLLSELVLMRCTGALHLATENGHAEVVSLLIAGGADVNANDLYYLAIGSTPLQLAVENGHAGIVRVLLAAGADVEKRGKGQRPLHAAAGAGRPDMVKMLLDGGAKVDSRDENDWTPLLVACDQVQFHKETDRDFPEVGRVLLAAGAKPDAADWRGLTTLDKLKPRKRKRPQPPHMMEQLKRFTKVVQEALKRRPKSPLTTKTQAKAKAKTKTKTNAPPPPAPKPTTAKEPQSLAQMRGVYNFETNEIIVLVQAPADRVTAAFRKHRKARQVIAGAYGKKVTLSDPCFVIYQLKDHRWTIIDAFVCEEDYPDAKDAQSLSRSLNTKAIFYANSDTAGATTYELFDCGESIECLDSEGGFDLKTASGRPGPANLGDLEPFIDQFFRDQDAYAPGWTTEMGGWCYNAGRSVKLDLSDAFTPDGLQRLDFVAV